MNATYRVNDPSPEVHSLARTSTWQVLETDNDAPVKSVEDPHRLPYYDEPVVDQIDRRSVTTPLRSYLSTVTVTEAQGEDEGPSD